MRLYVARIYPRGLKLSEHELRHAERVLGDLRIRLRWGYGTLALQPSFVGAVPAPVVV